MGGLALIAGYVVFITAGIAGAAFSIIALALFVFLIKITLGISFVSLTVIVVLFEFVVPVIVLVGIGYFAEVDGVVFEVASDFRWMSGVAHLIFALLGYLLALLFERHY